MERFEIISDDHLLAECPIWDDENGLLFFTDISAGFVFCYDPKERDRRPIISGKHIGGFRINAQGGFVCGCFDGVYLWSQDQGFIPVKCDYNGKQLKINDVTADACGRFIFGTNDYSDSNETQITGSVYALDSSAGITILDEGYLLCNGIGFSPDNKTLYTTDSVRRVIYQHCYDISTGTAYDKRIFARIKPDEGVPDGLAVDSEGFVWSAQWFGARIVRYDCDGHMERTINVPAKQVSSICFGGEFLSDLFITSSSENGKVKFSPPWYDYSYSDTGGQVFRIKTDIIGLPACKASVSV